MMQPFYLVWNPSTGYTMYRHESYHAAEKEAERLVRLHGGEFIVLRPMFALKKQDVVKTAFAPDDEIPF